MTAPTPTTPRSGNRAPMPNPVRAWSGLTLGTLAQVAVTFFVFTPAFLIPMLHTEQGVSLAEAGLLAAAPRAPPRAPPGARPRPAGAAAPPGGGGGGGARPRAGGPPPPPPPPVGA